MCSERGAGTYSYKTDVIIQIIETRDGYKHRVFEAGKLARDGEWYSGEDDPMVIAMWTEIGKPTPRQMGFPNYCDSDAIRDAFDDQFKGVDHNKFVRDKIAYHGDTDWAPCPAENDNPACSGGCTLQDFVDSAAKRGVTLKQIFRDKDCRCRKCRSLGV